MPEPYILVLIGLGALVLLVAWLPLALKELPLSLPIACVAIGLGLFSLPVPGPEPNPLEFPHFTERFSELVVIIALLGAGLKLDRPLGWRSWAATWRLLGITMPLSIMVIALIAFYMAGLPLAGAVLLAAALAPTDPVLASDVQVGPPDSGEEDDVRFSLTSEAGLNDGLAFPFVNFAIALALLGSAGAMWPLEWFGRDVLWKLGAGIAVGWVVGRALSWLTFHLPLRAKLSRTGDGFVGLGLTFLSYGLAEIVHGYGFLAVFVTALAFRAAERHHDYHERLHEFTEQTERLLMMVALVLFGGAIAEGMLAPLTWTDAAAGLLILLLVRPVTGWIGLVGTGQPPGERAVIAFFGIRGIGSVYYLAYGLNAAEFEQPERLWALLAFIVLVSIVVHGIAVTPVMSMLDRHGKGQAPGAGATNP